MKKIVSPKKIAVSMQPDGGARLQLDVNDGKDDEDVYLSPELWRRLGEDARWFMEQGADRPAAVADAADLGEVDRLRDRVKALEGSCARLEKSAAEHDADADAWSEEVEARIDALEAAESGRQTIGVAVEGDG